MDSSLRRALLPAFGMGLSVAATHGIGRFGYALLLPAMRESLGWTYLQASWMNTANAVGYIAGALSGMWLLGRMRVAPLFVCGLFVTIVSVSLTGLGGPFEWLFLMRILAGIGTAWAFSCGGALITLMYVHQPPLRGYATGLFFGGAGIGMVLTALTVPALVESFGVRSWRSGWFVLGIISAMLAVWPLVELRRAREARGPVPASGGGALRAGSLATQLAYFVYAAAHTAYMFFVFAWLRSSQTDWRLSAGMWMVLGASIFVSAVPWQKALGSWRASTTIGWSCFVVALGSALPLLQLTAATVVASAALVGSAIFIVPAATTVLVRQELPPAAWPRAVMFFTIVFSLGQAAGSWLTGWLADSFSLTVSLTCGSAGLLLSALLAGAGRLRDEARIAREAAVQ
jgi:predicted MFS family arabinose efflux permease